MYKKTNKTPSSNLDVHENSSKISSLSPRNILSTIGSRFFNLSQESTESKKTTIIHMADRKTTTREKEKPKKEERHVERLLDPTTRFARKYVVHVRTKDGHHRSDKPIDRDFRRFKAKYNASIGNILREWMSLIYCILILRMNLIKFVIANLPECSELDIHLEKQILLESKTLFNMIRDAQHSSQEKFLYLWVQLEKLIANRKLIRNGLQLMQMKDYALRDWKTADDKLNELQNEFNKYSEQYNAAQESKNEAENKTKENIQQLEKLVFSKDAEHNTLVEKITEMKKREVQMRGRILINMKSYKDLKAKKQKLINVEEKMEKLKTEQNLLLGEYTAKIQALKSEIEEKERLIRIEKEEKKKIRASLEGFGDYSEKATVPH